MILGQTHTHRTEQNREPRNEPHTYSQLIMTKEARLYNGERTVSKKWCWENWTVSIKRIKLDHFKSPYIQTESKWIKRKSI